MIHSLLSGMKATLDSASWSTLGDLPPELYSDILDCAPIEELQRTAAALSRAIPRSPVPRHYIYRYVRLTHRDQVVGLYQKLRKEKEVIRWVRTCALETWDVDAEAVVNLMNLLVLYGTTKELRLWIGQTFAPEHVEEIFIKPWSDLELLSLRFRP